MQNRMLTVLGVLASVALIAILALVINLSLSGPAQAQPTVAPAARHITVIGQGEVKGTPDTAYVQIGVETNAATTQEALAQNNAQTTAVIDTLKGLGVAEQDIQTSNFSIYAAYDDTGRQITGYTVNNMVSVTIRNLSQAGDLLDQVVQVGANRIYGISFGVDDPSELLAQARDRAVADARTRAERLAQASNTSLGEILVITENIGAMPQPMALGRGAIQDSAEAVPIQTGEQTFSTQVQVTFEMN